MIEMPPELTDILKNPNVSELQKHAVRVLAVSMLSAEIAQRISDAYSDRHMDPDKTADVMYAAINNWMKIWTTTWKSRDEAETSIHAVGQQCGVQLLALRGSDAIAWESQKGTTH